MPYPYMDLDEAFLGWAASEENIRLAVEKRQKFIWGFRNLPPNFCFKCPLYFRK